jgi:hypothetical protein
MRSRQYGAVPSPQNQQEEEMQDIRGSNARGDRANLLTRLAAGVCAATLSGLIGAAPAGAQTQPNIVFIMSDDVGWSNIGVYNQGVMAGHATAWARNAD